VLIRHAATDADAKGLLLGSRDEPLSGLGNVQAGKVAEFLLDMKVGCVTLFVSVVSWNSLASCLRLLVIVVEPAEPYSIHCGSACCWLAC
jgi:bisphosphoglycerate-dependent phosphoglycerate mutase